MQWKYQDYFLPAPNLISWNFVYFGARGDGKWSFKKSTFVNLFTNFLFMQIYLASFYCGTPLLRSAYTKKRLAWIAKFSGTCLLHALWRHGEARAVAAPLLCAERRQCSAQLIQRARVDYKVAYTNLHAYPGSWITPTSERYHLYSL